MLNSPWSAAAAGALGGAAIAIAAVFGAAELGGFPAASNAGIRNYLMANPQILVAMSDKLQQQQSESADAARQKAVNKIGLKAFFDPRVAFVTGAPHARRTFVEFFDYNCPYCRASLPMVKKFIAAHKNNARLAFIEFPIKGRESVAAARAAIAARKQPDKYIAFHLRLMGEKDLVTEQVVLEDARKAGLDLVKLKSDMGDPSIDATIAAAHNLASAIGVDGTPAFIIDGRIREGALDDSTLAELAKGRT